MWRDDLWVRLRDFDTRWRRFFARDLATDFFFDRVGVPARAGWDGALATAGAAGGRGGGGTTGGGSVTPMIGSGSGAAGDTGAATLGAGAREARHTHAPAIITPPIAATSPKTSPARRRGPRPASGAKSADDMIWLPQRLPSGRGGRGGADDTDTIWLGVTPRVGSGAEAAVPLRSRRFVDISRFYRARARCSRSQARAILV